MIYAQLAPFPRGGNRTVAAALLYLRGRHRPAALFFAPGGCEMPPAAYFFLSCQKKVCKKEAQDAKRHIVIFYVLPLHFRSRNALRAASSQTPYPSPRRKRQVSSVSLFLLFPHELLRWVRAGAPPLQSPLKRSRRGCCPFLDFPRGLVRAKAYFKSQKRDADAY